MRCGPLSEVQTATGLEVTLPCDLFPNSISSSLSQDKVTLVIWYKEGNQKPIYSFDARGKSLQEAVHWQDEAVLRSKAYFYYDTIPPALKIKNVKTEDAGLYRCRVDFQKTPTKNCRLNLSVLVPPTHLEIFNERGTVATNSVVGPYKEGSTVNITCMSSGGVPAPRVTWFKEHALIDDSFQELPNGTVRNVLTLPRITRSDLESTYTCQASNGHILPPLSNKVILDMKLPPLYIHIQGLNHPLTSGVKVHLSCSTAGARPVPQIIWTKGTQVMQGASQTTSSNGNITTSDIVYLPSPEDNGKVIACSVPVEEKNNAPTLSIKDTRILDIKHAPIVTLSLGSNLDPKNLAKGTDVYLECRIEANPPIKKIEWYHNNKPLHSSRGIIITNQSLVLQSISKQTHGQYMCRAANTQGSVSSNDLYLDIKYPPTCQFEGKILRAALRQTLNITCDIDSNPMKNLKYKWLFNSTIDNLIELPSYTNDPDLHYSIQHEHHQQQHIDSISSYKSKINYNSNELQQRSNQYATSSKKYQQQINYQNSLIQSYDASPYSHMNSYHSHHSNIEGVYLYKVDNFTSFGTISCSAENQYGSSGPCLYHIMVADLPDPVANCTAYNATAYTMQFTCIPGNDGGIKQSFFVEVFDGKEKIFNVSSDYPTFLLRKLPSDTKLVVRITPYNLQGMCKDFYQLRVKTMPAPLIKTASSRAVLVQITPVLGVLVGVVMTLLLIAICIVIFVKIKNKPVKKTPKDTDPNEPDKGSAEPLSRNLGSHSSIADEKNDPDIIPHDNSDDEKDFERLYTPTQLNYVNRHSPNSHSPTLRFGEKQYGELSLTTNPGFALYNNPTIRKYNVISSPTNANNPNTTTTTILRSKSPPNIYTRLPLKEYPSVSLTPTPMSPKLMTSSIVGYSSQGLSPTKHLLVTTPFMENGDLTTTSTNLATTDKCILSSVRMPLLNVNYKAEINNRINNGIVTNGSAMSQLSNTKES
ncbi:CLUMA_CG019078, isoform A [Clunio marinus]|uniref:CLUMA_CG019078, isoform A n=1 Tax=Clunio marinus TaxID=568069 RepID=A0A1J1J3G0_9DIPT|nr:CLUMA_CG019078, isoform A [Clunio marinus]